MADLNLIVELMQIHGVPDDAIRGVERDARRLCGGDALYVGKVGTRNRELRNERIRREFDGRNQRELARRFGVTRRTVYNILR